MEDKNLSEEEKRKKEEEISKRLQEIKNRLNKKKEEPNSEKEKKPKEVKSESAPKPVAKPAEPPSRTVDEKKADKKVESSDAASANPKEAKKKSVEAEIKMSGKPANDKGWSENKLKAEDKKTGGAESAATNPKVADTRVKAKPEVKEKKKSGGKKNRWILLAIIFIVLFSLAGWYLLSSNDSMADNDAVESMIAEDENLEESLTDVQTSEAEIAANESTVEEMDLDSDQPLEVEEKKSGNVVKNSKSQDESTENAPAPVEKPTPAVSRAKLELPCFVMSYVSTADESKAKRTVSELRNKGLSAGYYWIPDYTAGGPQLFKVFVGPYPNRQSAHGDLERIRKYNKDAYYHIVE